MALPRGQESLRLHLRAGPLYTGGLVFAAGGGDCRSEEFEILSGFEEPEATMGKISGSLGVVEERWLVVSD